MGKTTAKGELGEAMILADLQRQGHGVANRYLAQRMTGPYHWTSRRSSSVVEQSPRK